MADLLKIIETAEVFVEMETVKDTLYRLYERSKERADMLVAIIEENLKRSVTSEGTFLPIQAVCNKIIDYRGVWKGNCKVNDFSKKIKEACLGIYHEDNQIVTALANNISQGIDTLLDSEPGKELLMKSCFVFIENGKFMRLDLYIWGRKLLDEQVQKMISDVLSCVIYKSELDCKQMNFSTYLTHYMPLIKEAYPEDEEKVQLLLQEACSLYQTKASVLAKQHLNSAFFDDLNENRKTTEMFFEKVGC